MKELNEASRTADIYQDHSPDAGLSLVETVTSLRMTTRDGLSDDELTHLILNQGLAPEEGFAFACFSNGWLTMNVPWQDLAKWYPDRGWIAPEKEALARSIAEKYGLSLSEPPDTSAYWGYIASGAQATHHHLALFNRWETVLVIHPRYSKIRLFGRASGARCGASGQTPLQLGPGILRELAAFYRA